MDLNLIKELRERSGAGINDCKKALVECNDDIEKAIDYLREKGIATANKKASRIASEGIVEAYIHAGGKIGVLIEVNCETDFVAKNEVFRTMVRDIAMHIAATNPRFLSKEEVSQADIDREREVLTAQALNEGKPEKIVEKIVNGRIEKFYEENCLLEQAFVKNPDQTVGQLVIEKTAVLGEKLSVRRFVRWERGEGLEKKVENFAEEVMKQVNG